MQNDKRTFNFNRKEEHKLVWAQATFLKLVTNCAKIYDIYKKSFKTTWPLNIWWDIIIKLIKLIKCNKENCLSPQNHKMEIYCLRN